MTTTAQAFDYIHWKLSQLNLDRLADMEEREISKMMGRKAQTDYACPIQEQQRGRDRQRERRDKKTAGAAASLELRLVRQR